MADKQSVSDIFKDLMVRANAIAAARKGGHVTPSDLLRSAIEDPRGKVMLKDMGIPSDKLAEAMDKNPEKVDTNEATKRLLKSVGQNINLKSFINLLRTGDFGPASKIVRAFDIADKALSTTPTKELDPKTELARVSDDLNKLAKAGKLSHVIGRNTEIRLIIEVLSRHSRNNPILIGENGVGKTAIVEAIAQRIVDGDVPDSLKGKRILSLHVGSLTSGTSLRGELESKMSKLIQEVEKDGNIILLIDNIHLLVSGNDGVANLIKPALGSGIIKCIGTTSIDEFRKFEKDRTLASRFEAVLIAPPSVTETIAILRGVKPQYEAHHKVRIRDCALIAAAKMSDRYIPDKFLPAKAISLIDQSASALKCQIDSEPDKISMLRNDLSIKMDEYEAIKNEAGAENDIEKLLGLITNLREALDSALAIWASERALINDLAVKTKEISDLEALIEDVKKTDIDKATKMKNEELPTLVESQENIVKDLVELRKVGSYVREEVTDQDVGSVISRMTGIPVEKMDEGEKLLLMEDTIGGQVIGQKPAIQAIAAAVQRSYAGLSDNGRPLGVFFFLGPTGTGKTEMAKALAKFLFDDENSMVRLDMSEFQQAETINKLIGSANGYAGADEGGMLTEPVRRRPYSVVLFDEMDKANPKIMDTLLQVFDDGRLTDGKGRTVDFKNTIIIMTSNIGAQHVGDGEVTDDMKEKVLDELRKRFRPEFLNRFDDIVVFHKLGREHIAKIVNIQLKKIYKLLAERKYTLNISADAIALICEQGYDPAYGARPLKRAITNLVQNPLSREILSGRFKPGSTITINRDGNKLSIS